MELSVGGEGVGRGTDVLDGVHVPEGEGLVSGIFFCLYYFEWRIFKQKMYSTCA